MSLTTFNAACQRTRKVAKTNFNVFGLTRRRIKLNYQKIYTLIGRAGALFTKSWLFKNL